MEMLKTVNKTWREVAWYMWMWAVTWLVDRINLNLSTVKPYDLQIESNLLTRRLPGGLERMNFLITSRAVTRRDPNINGIVNSIISFPF